MIRDDGHEPIPHRLRPTPRCSPPHLLPGTELLGRARGSGLREPPYLVRRIDGEVVELSELLYAVARHLDGRDLDAVAVAAGRDLDARISPEQIRYAADEKLFPVGIVVRSDGTRPALQRRDALLALRHRVGIVPARWVDAVARVLAPLFMPAIVLAALAALVAVDVWLLAVHGVGRSVGAVIDDPALALALLGLVVASLAFHECGHAAACRYGGARPGRIGIGLYLIWPVFYTDVTDSYRLDRRGRLRTDLGGVYFNVLVALGLAVAYGITGFEPLILAIVSQQLLIVDQFVPWVRLDGYHVVSDLIGVSNLFARIRPVVRSLVPGRPADPRVSTLKPWARLAVTAWVLSTVLMLSVAAVVIAVHAPAYITRAWQSLVLQVRSIGAGGAPLELTASAVGTLMLVMPVAGILLTYALLCRRLGFSLALHRSNATALLGGKAPHAATSKMLAAPAAGRAPSERPHPHDVATER